LTSRGSFGTRNDFGTFGRSSGGALGSTNEGMPVESGAENIIGREVGTGVPLLGVDIRNVRSEHAPDGLVALTSRQVNLRPDAFFSESEGR